MAFAQNPQGVFIGKSGIDNVLLMLVGILFVVLLVLKHRYRHGHYHRLRLDVFLCIHFLVYGFGNDLYRFAPLRNFLLLHTQSYLRFRLTIGRHNAPETARDAYRVDHKFRPRCFWSPFMPLLAALVHLVCFSHLIKLFNVCGFQKLPHIEID